MYKFFLITVAATLLFAGCSSSKDSCEISYGSELSAVSFDGESSKMPQAPLLVSESDSEPEATQSESEASSGSEAPPLTVSVTIPEGYTLARIGMTLEDKGICTIDEFISAAQNGDYSLFSLIAEQDTGKNRCFRLEGYLFPDTYEFYAEDTPDAIIARILEHTEKMIPSDLRAQIAGSGYTIDEIITMASIIEKEAFGPEHMANISSVLHNRLSMGMRLQCDVTIAYVEGAIKPFITGDKDRYSGDYNTYKCDGLPAGAICNPGIKAIEAALNPADTPYLFFVTDKDKNYYFAETWEEHQQNVAVAMPQEESGE